jgi:hypothetical protein
MTARQKGEKVSGLAWKRNADEVLERLRRFLRRQMQDGILCTLSWGSVRLDCEQKWQEFERKWGTFEEGQKRPFPSNEEIFERETIDLQDLGRIEDDRLPVVYSTLDAGEGITGAFFGAPIRFLHRQRGPTFSKAQAALPDYARLADLKFSLGNPWVQRLLGIQSYFERRADGHFAQHPFLTMDALNFACELREASSAYLDVYEHPDELRQLMEVGFDFNIRFQQAQMDVIGPYGDGCFNWLSGWAPFPKAVSMSVDAHVICSVTTYAELGFDYNQRLIDHFGHGLMHFHCCRTDLAAEVAKLRGLQMFQYGGDTRDPLPEVDRLPQMRDAVGDIPIQVGCEMKTFLERLQAGTLMPNVWYFVSAEPSMSLDEANRLMVRVRAYRA